MAVPSAMAIKLMNINGNYIITVCTSICSKTKGKTMSLCTINDFKPINTIAGRCQWTKIPRKQEEWGHVKVRYKRWHSVIVHNSDEHALPE